MVVIILLFAYPLVELISSFFQVISIGISMDESELSPVLNGLNYLNIFCIIVIFDALSSYPNPTFIDTCY